MVSPNEVRSPADRSTKMPRSICVSTLRAHASASLRVRSVSVTGGQPVRRTCACHCSGPFWRIVAIVLLLTHATRAVPKLCQQIAKTGNARRPAIHSSELEGEFGAPERIRTSDLCLRRAALYPAELRARADLDSAQGGARQRRWSEPPAVRPKQKIFSPAIETGPPRFSYFLGHIAPQRRRLLFSGSC